MKKNILSYNLAKTPWPLGFSQICADYERRFTQIFLFNPYGVNGHMYHPSTIIYALRAIAFPVSLPVLQSYSPTVLQSYSLTVPITTTQ
jgi:hypothetical protein